MSSQPANDAEVRIDLHVHSSHSDRPYSWFLRSAQSAECYTTPATVYATAKARGMNLVTLCDHDTIDGALELRALADDTFISEEVSARFPEDGCVVHTIAIDITESQHRDIQSLRANVYELVSYLHQQSVEFFLCHPLSQVNHRLQAAHLERCLLMFRNLELRNGTRDAAHEDALRRVLGGLTPETMSRYAERHPRVPFINRDGRYGLVGGSDDHAGLSIARAFTTFSGARTGAGLTAALRERRTAPGGLHGTTAVLQHNVYGVMGGYFKANAEASGESAMTPALTETLGRYADHFMGAQEADGPVDLAGIPRHGHTDPTQEQLAKIVETVLVRSSRDALGDVAKEVFAARPVELADKIPAVLKAITVSLPAVLGARWHGHDIQSARRFSADLGFADGADGAPRVAILTDTIDDVNGVSLGLRRLRDAMVAAGHDVRLVSFGDGDHVSVDADGVVRLPAVLRHRLADYPEMEFAIPHLPSLVGYLIENRIGLLQCSTPGPVGWIGLLAARTVGIPVVGQYHTDLPEYGTRITGDPVVGAILGKVTGWFYGAMDRVFAPSQSVVERLAALGVAAAKVARLPRGIDLDLFSPTRFDGNAFAAIERAAGERPGPHVLYVGRLSREKGLDALIDGFAAASSAVPHARLVVVGDGPAASALQARAARAGRVTFLGTRRGAELARIMASSDVFVSTSETETFGNTVVEAQASGLPVVVASRGAAHENMLDGVTGLVVDGRRAEEIGAAIRLLLTDHAARGRMSRAAVEFSRRYDMTNAAAGTYAEYRRFLAERAGAAARPAEPREKNGPWQFDVHAAETAAGGDGVAARAAEKTGHAA